MTAICPAGPPKLSAAMRTQVQSASRKGTGCGAAARPTPAMAAPVVSSLPEDNLLSKAPARDCTLRLELCFTVIIAAWNGFDRETRRCVATLLAFPHGHVSRFEMTGEPGR